MKSNEIQSDNRIDDWGIRTLPYNPVAVRGLKLGCNAGVIVG